LEILTKAKEKLGWVPKYDLAGLVKEMVASDLKKSEKNNPGNTRMLKYVNEKS